VTEPHMLILTSGGRLTSCELSTSKTNRSRVSDVPLLGAAIIEYESQGRRLIVATEDARIITYSWSERTWNERASQSLSIYAQHGRMTGSVDIKTFAELGDDILVVTTATFVVFLDGQSLAILSKLDLATAGDLLISSTTHCPACSSVALLDVGVAAECSDKQVCRVVSLATNKEEQIPLCLRNNTQSCRPCAQAKMKEHIVADAGAWRALTSYAVLGLRKRTASAKKNAPRSSGPAQLRRPRHSRQKSQLMENSVQWEAYMFSLDGEMETVGIPPTTEGDAQHTAELYVNTAGPAVALEPHSVAVAFGNTVKIVRASRRGSIAKRPNGLSLQRHTSTSKKRLTLRKSQ